MIVTLPWETLYMITGEDTLFPYHCKSKRLEKYNVHQDENRSVPMSDHQQAELSQVPTELNHTNSLAKRQVTEKNSMESLT
jgi:hypothetical protein